MRNRRVTMTTMALISLFVIPTPADAKRNKKQHQNRVPDELIAVVDRVSAGRSNFYLRSAFDSDPSGFIGRFVPEVTDTANLDESSTYPSRCSEYISYRTVGGGGVEYDEYFNASSSVAAGLSLPILNNQITQAGVSVDYSGGSIVRIRYTLTQKMVADITDPQAFGECCAIEEGACSDLYISEFMEGQGQVMHYTSSAADVDAGVGIKGVELGTEIKDGLAWSRAVNFPNPVYFAFKTSPVPPPPTSAGGRFDECGDWRSSLPRSLDGTYFVGMSDPLTTEASARDEALANGRKRAVHYLGEAMATGSITDTQVSGPRASLEEALQNEAFVHTASAGIARMVVEKAWCMDRNDRDFPDGVRYIGQVLVFFPTEAEEGASQTMIDLLPGPTEDAE